MLSLSQLNDLVNNPHFDSKEKWQEEIVKRRDVYFGMSLHIDGACPAWYLMRDPRIGWLPGNLLEKRPIVGWYGYEYHWIFDNILFNRYPNEPEVIRQWRFSNYKPFQKVFFDKCISMVTGAIFQDSSYSVTIQDKDDNDYIWGNNFEVAYERGGRSTKTNLVQYFAANFKTIAGDPNGLFLVIPRESSEATTAQRIEPVVWFIHSKFIRFITPDEIAFWHDGYRWVVNKFGYFRWRKKEQSDTWELVEPNGYYGHMLGYIPAFVAGGQWNNQGFYESWLHGAKAIADDYVITKSDQAMCAKQASNPWVQEADVDCPDCTAGKIQQCNACHKIGDRCVCDEGERQWVLANCATCGGTGGISNNPGQRIIVPKDMMDKDMVRVINIPVDANKMHSENAETSEINLQKALHLSYIDEAQSAVAKQKDMETRYQFIMGINNDFFDRLIHDAAKAISALRNISVNGGTVAPTPSEIAIVKPTQFQIKTSYDLLEEMKAGKESGIPVYQYGALLEDYVDKQFGGNDVLKKKTCIINQMDDLANRPVNEIAILVLNGAATQRDW